MVNPLPAPTSLPTPTHPSDFFPLPKSPPSRYDTATIMDKKPETKETLATTVAKKVGNALGSLAATTKNLMHLSEKPADTPAPKAKRAPAKAAKKAAKKATPKKAAKKAAKKRAPKK